jgi:hypothetical protein
MSVSHSDADSLEHCRSAWCLQGVGKIGGGVWCRRLSVDLCIWKMLCILIDIGLLVCRCERWSKSRRLAHEEGVQVCYLLLPSHDGLNVVKSHNSFEEQDSIHREATYLRLPSIHF